MSFKLKILFYLIGFKFNRWFYGNNLLLLRKKRFNRFTKQLVNSKYYKQFLKPGISIMDFPIINKSVFVEKFDVINTGNIKLEDAYSIAIKAEETRDFSPMINGATIGLSSGTSGNRGIFLASENERARWVACILDRVIGFSLKKRTVAFFLRANSNLYDSVKSSLLEFHYFDLLNPVDDNIEQLKKIRPTILVAQPSMLIEIAKVIEENKLVIHPDKIISVAEVLTPEDKSFLSKVFKQTIHQAYQCTEGFLAYTCKYGTLHFNEDFLIIEKKYVDKEQQRYHPVITDLMRTLQPVIRYELNDIIIEKKYCACGNKMLAIEQIEGRSDDVLVFESANKKEVKIFPDFFRLAIILSDSQITEYSVIQKSAEQLDLFIRSASNNSYDSAAKAIRVLLEQNNITGVRIVRLDNNNHRLGTKLRRIKNDSWKTN